MCDVRVCIYAAPYTSVVAKIKRIYCRLLLYTTAHKQYMDVFCLSMCAMVCNAIAPSFASIRYSAKQIAVPVCIHVRPSVCVLVLVYASAASAVPLSLLHHAERAP